MGSVRNNLVRSSAAARIDVGLDDLVGDNLVLARLENKDLTVKLAEIVQGRSGVGWSA